MEGTRTMEESYSQYGYPAKKVIASVVLATVLHVVVLGAYFILGSSHKPPAAAAKPAEGDAAKGAATAPPKDGKAPGETAAKPPSGTGDEKKTDKTPDEIKKSTDVAKPGEIPSKPDTDIDEILKRK